MHVQYLQNDAASGNMALCEDLPRQQRQGNALCTAVSAATVDISSHSACCNLRCAFQSDVSPSRAPIRWATQRKKQPINTPHFIQNTHRAGHSKTHNTQFACLTLLAAHTRTARRAVFLKKAVIRRRTQRNHQHIVASQHVFDEEWVCLSLCSVCVC
jgi:hypothetical protein